MEKLQQLSVVDGVATVHLAVTEPAEEHGQNSPGRPAAKVKVESVKEGVMGRLVGPLFIRV